MSLRNQVALLLATLSVAFVAVTYGVQTWVVLPTFFKLERQAAERNVGRCADAITHDIETLSNCANDWAAWDDTCRYVDDHNAEFAQQNLINETFVSAHINFLCILDNRRRIVWSEARDLETLKLIDVPTLRAMLQEETCPFTQFQNLDEARTGIALTKHGPMLMASRPIITSKREGPMRGTVVMGLFLNSEEIARLAERTRVELNIWTVTQEDMPVEARRNLERLQREPGPLFELHDAQTLYAYAVLHDVHRAPAILVRVDTPRDVTLQGRVSARVATGCSLLGGLLTVVAMWLVLHWRIVGPLQDMAAHALRVGRRDDLKARLRSTRRDEIGTLASEFDRMVEHLAASRKKVLESAHRAGMAEIASDVLHNVGNAVNSANCALEFLDERLQASKTTGLERAGSLLREQAPRAAAFFGRDPRAPKLIDYLVNLSEALQKERHENQADVARLRETVRHIRDAIVSQQEHADRSDFRQEVAFAALVDDALQLNCEAIASSQVHVDRNVPAMPDLLLNKSKTTQILANLVRNAIQAMRDQPRDARHLTITAQLAEDGALEIEVRDTGVGFGADVQAQLFMHGFTTKLEGHGFGLHYCANAVKDAGGHITAHSPGPGLGATFRLRIPHAVPAAAVAT